MSHSPLQIVAGEDFTKASARLPKEIRSKLSKATANLFNNSGSWGAHQEKIHSKDDDVYSLRVDDGYRIIYKQPGKSNIVMLLYVDKHDDAYAWAQKHCTGINPSTGGVQTSVSLIPNTTTENGRIKTNPKLSVLSDTNMLTLQIPQPYWEQLRTKVFSPRQLLGYKNLLSYETYSTLEEMLNGLPVQEALQLYSDISETFEIPAIESETIEPMFDKISNDDLMRVGIPQQFLNLVRTVRIEEELVNLASVLPADAMQSLYAIRNGDTIDSIIKLTYADSHSVCDEDYKAALANPLSKAQFVCLEDEEAMKALLELPAAQWRAYLHPSQRRMIEKHYAGPARIIGGAGTGKTVVIVHRAKFLTQYCQAGEKVFVTSFNKSLVADIEARLATICSKSQLDQIEVQTVDKKTYHLAGKIGYKVIYGKAVDEIWNYAIVKSGIGAKYNLDFLKDEWMDVIQAQQITSKEAYIKAQRIGRSKRLDQSSREDIWKVFEIYKERCKQEKCLDSDWAQNLCAIKCTNNPNLCSYRSVLVDECQDLRAPAYRMLRAIAGNQRQDDIFISGDSRQRIYKGRASLSQCGITINNRSNMLKLNYRTTAEIYEAAMRIQQGYQYDDLDGTIVDQDYCTCIFHGEKPTVKGFPSKTDEWDAIVDDIRTRIQSGIPSREICILVKTNKLVNSCADKLKRADLEVLPLSSEQSDDLRIQGIRLATMHRVKGMEYTCVYIPFMQSDYMPSQKELDSIEDDSGKQERLKQDANLLSVAMTRAKRFVWISYSGVPSQYLRKLEV